jgi:cytochrome c biogenesis protein CcmG/thiol:disulfide interchange protein DsbE
MENKQTAIPTVPASPAPAAARPRQLPAWVIVLAFLILVGFLALIAWGLNRAQQGSVQIHDAVPAFTLTGFDGKDYKTADLTGKVIVVNFWASWCKPCEQEAADMEAAWLAYKPTGNVVFLGVDWVDTAPEAKSYLDKFGITYLNGPDLRTAISQIFRIKGVPETYILGKDGRLANVKIGPFASSAEIQAMVDPLLK